MHVEFLQAIPIYESERRFKNQHSAEALLERWEDAQVRFWDPRRARRDSLTRRSQAGGLEDLRTVDDVDRIRKMGG